MSVTRNGDNMIPLQNRHSEDAKRTVAAIKPVKLAQEPGLLLTKWPDYAFMSPMQSTILFAREYSRIYREKLAKYVDRDLAKNAKGIDLAKLLTDKQTLSSVWEARQIADQFGLPYDNYIDFSLEFASRRQWQYFPRPNQLGPVGRPKEAWLAEFDGHKLDLVEAGLLTRIEHPGYAVASYCELPNQIMIREMVVENAVVFGHNYHRWMRMFVDQLQLVTMDDFQKKLPENVFEYSVNALETIRADEGMPNQRPGVLAADLQPSCYSLKQIGSLTNQVCLSCRLQSACSDSTTEVLNELASAGIPTRVVADRDANAKRQQAFRIRRRSQKIAGNPIVVSCR